MFWKMISYRNKFFKLMYTFFTEKNTDFSQKNVLYVSSVGNLEITLWLPFYSDMQAVPPFRIFHRDAFKLIIISERKGVLHLVTFLFVLCSLKLLSYKDFKLYQRFLIVTHSNNLNIFFPVRVNFRGSFSSVGYKQWGLF